MAVKVQFEIGHTSKLRAKKTPEGFTHDWELYVQGVNKADISSFVDKIVFNLHKTFPKPKRVLKEPPYILQESGYAGFLLPIDIYFRSRDEPKRFEFTYDLHLQPIGPPYHQVEVKNFIFENPSDEFRQKLLKGGGIPVAGVVSVGTTGGTSSSITNSNNDDTIMVSKPKLSAETISKKHKIRTDESKMSTFANLFGTPITKGGNKQSPDTRTNNVGSKSETATNIYVKSNNSNNVTNIKERPNKDKDKSSTNPPIIGGTNSSSGIGSISAINNTEKVRDKKEKHKQLSPNKESKSENKKSNMSDSKHEKRSEERAKKDKLRDKDRDRSREKGGSASKRVPSPKGSNRTVSPRRQSPGPLPSKSIGGNILEESRFLTSVNANKSDMDNKSKFIKSKEGTSNSSKKQKKEKKDKDRDKEKREDHKQRAQSSAKEARPNINVSKSLSSDVKDSKDTPPRNAAGTNKKNEKDIKMDISKSKSAEKLTEKDVNEPISSSGSAGGSKKTANSIGNGDKEKKSHKHKKKEKGKDKEKEREREKDRDKEKLKERDKEKMDVKILDKISNTNTGKVNNMETNGTLQIGNNLSVAAASSKKPVNKEKKSKEKNKDDKRDIELDAKNKHTKSITASRHASSSSTSIHSGNIELSDADSPRSMQDSLQTSQPNSTAAQSASVQYSDSSNSSFPELSTKSTMNILPPSVAQTKQNTSASPSLIGNLNRESKQSRNSDKSDTIERVEKENKKRRRNSTTMNTFIEPPVKQSKKESQGKITREKSKSPLLRPTQNNNSDISGNGTFLQPSLNSTGSTSLPTINSNSNSVALMSPGLGNEISNSVSHNNVALGAVNIGNNTTLSTQTSGINSGTNTQLIFPMDYLNELQELHQKIMMLQDGEELQQVVEMIAATGCYEITSKTFDFDLCKLDRNTVQRLQEFFATSVS